MNELVILPPSAIEELKDFMEQMYTTATEARCITDALCDNSDLEYVDVKRSSLTKATQILKECAIAVDRAMRVIDILSEQEGDIDIDIQSTCNSSDGDDISSEIIDGKTSATNSCNDTIDSQHTSRKHEQCSNSNTLFEHSYIHESVGELPKVLNLDPMHHLLFVIHGIGEHDDFKQGNAASDGDYPSFKAIFRSFQTSLFQDIPLVLDLESIEWHDELHHPTGLDSVFDMIAPVGSQRIRDFNKSAFMDILYYSSPAYGQLIINSVTEQMNEKYHAYRSARPDWNGRVSIFAHSLGTIIAYDILTHAKGETHHGVTFPGLDFEVENFFAAGSPVPVMILARGDVNLAEGNFVPGICEPRCHGGYFNILHPSDPISYRVEPLMYPNTHSVPAVRLVQVQQIKREKQPFLSLVNAYDELTISISGKAPRHDFEMQRYRQEGLIELANAPAAHSTYWSSEDVVAFTLMHICKPLADILRSYASKGYPPPKLVSRHGATLSPSSAIDMLALSNVKHHIAWHSRILLMDSNYLYIVKKNHLACKKRWQLQLTPGTLVLPTDEKSFMIRGEPGCYTETTEHLLSILNDTSLSKTYSTSSTRRRDAWIQEIQTAISNLREHNEIEPRRLDLPKENSCDFFRARKAGHVLRDGKSSRWMVLTSDSLQCYNSPPTLDPQYILCIRDSTISVVPSRSLLRLASHTGVHLEIQLKNSSSFIQWKDFLEARGATIFKSEEL